MQCTFYHHCQGSIEFNWVRCGQYSAHCRWYFSVPTGSRIGAEILKPWTKTLTDDSTICCRQKKMQKKLTLLHFREESVSTEQICKPWHCNVLHYTALYTVQCEWTSLHWLLIGKSKLYSSKSRLLSRHKINSSLLMLKYSVMCAVYCPIHPSSRQCTAVYKYKNTNVPILDYLWKELTLDVTTEAGAIVGKGVANKPADSRRPHSQGLGERRFAHSEWAQRSPSDTPCHWGKPSLCRSMTLITQEDIAWMKSKGVDDLTQRHDI